MKSFLKRYTHPLVLTLLGILMVGCVENTGSLGILNESDEVTTSTAVYQATSCSVNMGVVKADNSNAFLGKVVDPETGSTIEADFAAQFYCFENYSLPTLDRMVGDITVDAATGDTTNIQYGVAKCDSCEVHIYIKDYYGEGNNPMKLEVYELDESNIMEETDTFYTNVDLSKYVKTGNPIVSKVFTVDDYIVDESVREESGYNKCIRIIMPTSFGQSLLEKCLAKPEDLKDSYHFIRNIFPGFYFRIANGEGTMIKTLVSSFNLYYNYCSSTNRKTIYEGVTRFTATPEVIQCTHFENGKMDNLLAETNCTYLKTPAGICTELTLPIDEIFDEHPTDSVSKAQITLQRYNKEQTTYQLSAPSYLVMIRECDVYNFFRNRKVNDNRTSFLTSLSTGYNTYTFSNIARLLSYCKQEKRNEAAKAGITEEQWAALHPEWNKVLLVPVSTTSNSSGSVTSVTHEMGMYSAKLIGGDTKLNLDIVYSKFK